FVNPSRWNPTQRETGKLLDLIFTATWTGVSENCDVWLVGNSEFMQERASILSAIPDRNEIKLHLWIVLDGFGPPTALELGLTVGAPRRPEVNNSGLWRFDGGENGLVRRGFSTQRCSP